jgi:formate dehydrogenase major subunit
VFGAGGGTNSYEEVEHTDLIVLWGSNARETHPIFFHHVLKGIHNGAKLYVIDPRRTASAQWADGWLGVNVGSDIALANAIAREILVDGLENRTFIDRATLNFEEYRKSVERYTLDYAQEITGVPAAAIRELAHAYARADRAMICWTLGITEHHNAVDSVVGIINLALLTGKVGRYGCGVNPLRGQNNVQGGGDMGAIPDRLAGFQSTADAAAREKFEKAWNCTISPERGKRLNEMFDAMEEGELTALYCIGENPVVSEADRHRAVRLLEGLEHMVVQDISLTQTARLASVVLPAAAGWVESDGTVTNSERRVQRVRKVIEPPGNARDDMWIVAQIAKRLGRDWGSPTAQDVWDEVRSLSPMHAGMSYERLEQLNGLRWPCPDENDPGALFLHGRLWADPVEGPKAPFHAVEYSAPLDAVDAQFPLLLTTGRRLDSYNSGVATGEYSSPLRRVEALEISPEEAARHGLSEGEIVAVSSRRGKVFVPVHIDRALREGLAFMTFHFDVPTNVLTLDTVDPKSGTAEFKATAIRIDKIGAGSLAAAGD